VSQYQINSSLIALTKLMSYSYFSVHTEWSDFADFYYYRNDVPNPYWQLIVTLKPTVSGFSDIAVDYVLPDADIHMVRVSFRYNGGPRYGCIVLFSVLAVQMSHLPPSV
jgi:hypothetical protein